ncbi:MAG: YIP1 family protein [Acidobacteria bacterium]|nr:YIP1 family protein [Acidobacteriota bacterium]
MSSLPPDGSFPPPPPPPPEPPSPYRPPNLPPAGWGGPPEPPAGPGTPWETAPGIDLNALLQTFALFVTKPVEAYTRTRASGDYTKPILYALVTGIAGAILGTIWGLVIPPNLAGLPPEFVEKLGFLLRPGVGQVLVSPFSVLFGIFVGGAVLHVCALITGCLKDSKGGFEGTLRVVAYGQTAALAAVVPFVGPFVSGIWTMVLWVIGIRALHRTTTGKAVFAVLLPVALCCICGIVAVVFAGAAIFGAAARG